MVCDSNVVGCLGKWVLKLKVISRSRMAHSLDMGRLIGRRIVVEHLVVPILHTLLLYINARKELVDDNVLDRVGH